MLGVFVFNDIYFFLNRKRMSANLADKDVMSVRHLDLAYYFVKAISVVWPFIGLFTAYNHYFLVVICAWLFRFVLYHIHKRIYAVYSIFVPFAVAAVYIYLTWIWATR